MSDYNDGYCNKVTEAVVELELAIPHLPTWAVIVIATHLSIIMPLVRKLMSRELEQWENEQAKASLQKMGGDIRVHSPEEYTAAPLTGSEPLGGAGICKGRAASAGEDGSN